MFSSHVGINLDGNQHVRNGSYEQILLLFDWCQADSSPPEVVEGREGLCDVLCASAVTHFWWLISIQIVHDP